MRKKYTFFGAALAAILLVPAISLAVNYLTVSDTGTLTVNGNAIVSGNVEVSGSVTALNFIPQGDNFDTYSNGNLNNNNGGFGFSAAWSGSTAFDVRGATVFKGSKAVKVSQAAGQEPAISRTFTPRTTGTVHWAQRKDGTDHNQCVNLRSGLTPAGLVCMAESPGGPLGQVWGIQDGASFTSTGTSYSTSTWYTVDLEFNAITDQYRVAFNGGAYTDWKSFQNAVSSIDKIEISAGAGGFNTVDGYWDDFEITD